MDADYIVVGAGSAGAVLAARLSEDPSVRVLLVEAGGRAADEVLSVPAMWPDLFMSEWDWDYWSEPEPHLDGRRTYLPRGKGLGGTSAVNGLLYVRGVPLDYDEWAAAGHHGWSWDDVLPCFIRSERNVRGASPLHGDAGRLHVEDRVSDNEIVEAWVQAAQQAGHAYNPDFNGPEQEGVGYFQLTQRAARRCSTATAYLADGDRRPNLTVLTHARAHRIVMDRERAVGVEVERAGEITRHRAEREVIVSAGAYNSPQLLMLSGIGPAAHLEEMGIEPLIDLPVGDGLQEHPGVPIVLETDRRTISAARSAAAWEAYRRSGTGPFASNVVEAGGFFRTRPELPTPDVEIVVLADTLAPAMLDTKPPRAYTLTVQVLKPTSVGKVRLRTGLPGSKVRIQHNHFATAEDRAAILAGLRINLDIAGRPPLAGFERGRILYPAEVDDTGLWEYVRRNGQGLWHPSSSCAMGSVVDSELRVYGTTGLRVADASVMPSIVRGNPNAAVIMIGERAADLVRDSR